MSTGICSKRKRSSVRLGEALLNIPADESQANKKDCDVESGKNNLYFHTIQLSNFFKSMKVFDIELSLSRNKIDPNEILQHINIILQDLKILGKGPSVDIGSHSATYEAYELISFAFLYLFKNNLIQPLEKEVGRNDETELLLREKIKELESQIQFMNNDCELISDFNSMKNALFHILNELNLSTNSTTNEVVTAIRTLIYSSRSNEITQLKKEIFRLQNYIQENNNDNSINMKNSNNNNDNNNARIFVLESELQSVDLKCKGLAEENQRRREKINSLNLENQDLQQQINSLKSQIQDLKMGNEKLLIEKDELSSAKTLKSSGNSSLSELTNGFNDFGNMKQEILLKENENKKLNEIIEILAKQMDEINGNLKHESTCKNQLFRLLQEQKSALIEYENIFESFVQQIKNSENALKLCQQHFLDLEEKQRRKTTEYIKLNEGKIMESLKYYFVSSSSFSMQIKTVNQEIISRIIVFINNQINKNKDEKDEIVTTMIGIINIIFNSFLEQKGNCSKDSISFSELESKNKRLIQYCYGLVQFFEHLANSGEMQAWMIDIPVNKEEFRPFLLAQCQKVEEFLMNNQEAFGDLTAQIDFSAFPTKMVNTIKGIEIGKLPDDELILVLHICSLANDALRRCADNMLNANHHLTNEIQTLKHELKQSNHENDLRLKDLSYSLQKELNEHVSSKKAAEDLLSQIQNELRFTKRPKDAVKKCLSLMNDDDDSLLTSSDDNANDNDFCSKKEEINNQNCDYNNLLIKIKEENIDLLKQKNLLEKQILQKDEKIDSIETVKGSLQRELERQKKVISNLYKEKQNISNSFIDFQQNNSELKQIISDQKEKINQIQQSSTNKDEEEKELISSLTEEVENWKSKHDYLISSITEEKRKIKRESKITIKKLFTEIKSQQNKNEELRNHFEPLLNDLRHKVKEAHEEEKKAISNYQELENKYKRQTSDLVNAKIDIKMLQMNLSAIEEKTTRDKSLLETQCRMNLLNIQAKHQTEIEHQRTEFECKNHEFRIMICQRFKEFVDFNNIISDGLVFEILDKVVIEMKKLSEMNVNLTEANNEMQTIRTMFGIDSKENALPHISKLFKKINKYKQMKYEHQKLSDSIQKQQQQQQQQKVSPFDPTAYEWEQWAKKLAALVSDSFLSLRTSRDLMFSIEEALLGGIGQRLMTKRLEMLRIEKQIFLSGLLNMKYLNRLNSHPSMKTMILLLTAIRKLQKVSGHLPCSIPLPVKRLMKKGPENNRNTEKKMYPIISYE